MTLDATMTALAGAIQTAAPELRVYDWPTESVTVPCAVVAYPDMDFDVAYGTDGAYLATYPVWVLVGTASTRAARADVAPYIDSLVPVLNGTIGGHSASCHRARLALTTIAGTAYLGLLFSVEIIEA